MVPKNDENIPLDEMMRNLKRGAVKKQAVDVDGGQRVIRADGSEAIKVRTKKRRSVQPKEEAEKKSVKRKIILISSVIGLALISVIAFSFFIGYYNGNRFKSDVTKSIVNISGANAELGKLEVSPSSSNLSKVDLSWSDDHSVLKKLTLTGVIADCGILDLVAGGLGVNTVGVREGSLKLSLTDQNPDLKTTSELPFEYSFGLYQCSNFNIIFGDDSQWKFSKGSVSYRPSSEPGNLNGQFSVDNGSLTVPSFGEFNVKNGLIELGKQEAKVYLSLDSDEFGGQINIDGTSGYTSSSTVNMKTVIRDYKLKGLIESKNRRFIHGHIASGEGTFKMNLGDVSSYDISSDLVMRDVTIGDFPFIRDIAQLMEDDYYANPTFSSKLSMTLKRNASRTEFTNIDLKQELFMCVKGNVAIDNVNLVTGTVKVGLPVTALTGKNGELLRSVFIENDGEFIWTTVQVSGDLSAPKDDMRDQLDKYIIKSDEQKFEELFSQ